jgi:quercetin dioxygenase-like cupin family protein
MAPQLTVFNVLRGEALKVSPSAYGSVGELFAGEGLEVVWVAKEGEDVDPEWFSQDRVDLILVMQGQLRLEFERSDLSARVLGPGDCIVLPANTRCRAYRWPRERREASVFVAVSPRESISGAAG